MTDLLCLNSIRGKSGKDTLIGLLESEGRKVFRVAFGDVLKDQCAQVLAGGPGEHAKDIEKTFHSSAKDQKVPHLAIHAIADSSYRAWLLSHAGLDRHTERSPRWHLQQFGTEYQRVFLKNPDVWLNAGLKCIETGLESGVDHIVVTDMRQANEYETLSCTPNAKTIRIQREWFIPGVDEQPYHITDIGLMAHPFDALVVNRLGDPWAMLDQLKEQGVIK